MADTAWIDAYEERKRTGKFVGQLRFKRKDGSIFPGEVNSMLLRLKDGSNKTCTVFWDITSRIEAEQRLNTAKKQLQDIIDGAPNLVFTKDLQGHFCIINKKLREILGTDDKELKGKTDFDIHPKDTAELFHENDRRVIESGNPIQIEEEARLADGTHYYFMTNKFPLRDEKGDIYAVCGISTDITAYKKLELELRESENRLIEAQKIAHIGSFDYDLKTNRLDWTEELYNIYEIDLKKKDLTWQDILDELGRSNKELENFAYIASHDLQEPLRMVSSYMGLLERKYKDQLDEKAKQYIHFAVDGSKRMSELIHDLLSYSRLTTKSEPFKPTDLNSVLSDVRRDLQIAILETRTELEIDQMPVDLKTDSMQIKQLFQNLIQNAIKFRNKENPVVKVTAERKGKEWIFGVKDNGIGINPEHHEKIFMLFQRLHERDKYPGTGLGLAICNKIVERHGGHIWVESEEGKGTSFYFKLPA